MPRYRLLVEYDGSVYAGWQMQSGPHSVQAAIEQAILAFSGEEARTFAAGRTDAGVHAAGQVVHFDLSRHWPAAKVADAINAKLRLAGETIAVLRADSVPESFHARYSAVARHYLYRILNRRAPPALERDFVWWVRKRLDAEAMHEAAQILIGTHDFTTFRSTLCQADNPVRTLGSIVVSREGDHVEIRASARSFLHNQVRSIAGSLKLVGEGSWNAGDLGAALAARDRRACGPVAPARGLFLVGVDYREGSGPIENSA